MVWPDIKFELPWEWNSQNALRNTIYPGFISIPLFFLKFTGLDQKWTLILIPKLQHLALYILSYICFYKYLKKEFGKYIAKISILLILSNFASNMILTRTFSNSLEALLFCVGLYLTSKIPNGKKWEGSAFNFYSVSLTFIVACSVMIRCSSAITWIPLLIDKVFLKRNFLKMVLNFIVIGVPTIFLALGLDSLYYGRWTLTPINFLNFNVIENGSANYGVSPPLWYVYFVIPFWMNILLPFTLLGSLIYLKTSLMKCRFPFLIVTVLGLVGVASMIPHKEERFIIAVLPALIIFTAIGLK